MSEGLPRHYLEWRETLREQRRRIALRARPHASAPLPPRKPRYRPYQTCARFFASMREMDTWHQHK